MSRRTASSIAASSLARLNILSSTRVSGSGAIVSPTVNATTIRNGPLVASTYCNNDKAITANYSFSTATASSSSSSASSSSSSSSSDYKSPFEDYFNMIQTNQSTISGPSPSTLDPNFVPPEIPRLKCGIAEHDLKFKTTSYSRLMLPPYVHTNEYKVILEVNVNLLPLENELERKIFHQIVGTRFHEGKNRLKLTCNLFASRIENKRHLCSMLDRIVLGAKRLAAEMNESMNE
mmetsp:Transcript_21968/g.27709  ORF Transcript_21968/g.27709 Transcript_21968/m.27709 type:complete len:234 (+) Transcript_21968:278-979(+)|eukprot:CAMPEP_0203656870 /NCGR_PEP_ID=MMETSP0088-20131115/42854_1 /ASSEMBLY_ACC=CAM_ASM_001087 /TAXON_ID=426623 /ORGANISM="Chaetoceros affinis, Strain CCMP159" /LENGTH=233 /DNA_ID=CAMNT_0050517973 /DNA_START=276 /DNA_END=977 /DNA_ORIENTATION=+